MRKKLTASVQFLILSFFLVAGNLLLPKNISATIGSHLGYGDINQQLQALDILKNNGAGGGFPVTVMTRLDTADADFERLAQKIADYNFFAIVRIDGVCNSNPLAIGVAGRANNIFSAALGNNFIITYGNEVNNQQVECSNWSTYADNYNQIDGGFSNLSPSALDWYNANYPASDFLQATGLGSQYQNAPVRTANAYGCIGETANSCDPGSTSTQLTGMTDYKTNTFIPSSKLYLTEFSLSPGGTNPPDSDLNKVVQFIQNRAAETHAIHITPLIRNVCTNIDGEWLYYVNGKIISPDGEIVDPDNCSIDKVKSFSTKDLNDYLTIPLILQPDKSLNDTGYLTDTLLYNMVVDQGYEVSCASPQLFVDPAAVDRLLDYFSHKNTEIPPGVDPGTKILKLEASDSHKVQMIDAEIPIYRGSEASELTNKLSSYEAFFGTLNPNQFDPDEPITSSGVAGNLLSASQQCTIKLDNMDSARTLCETLENPSACALHRQIPETSYYLYSTSSQETTEPSLFTAINHYSLSCDQLTGNWDDSYESGISHQEFVNIQQALNNSPIDIDNLYRYAFVILSPMQDWDESCGLSAADRTDRFWYLNWNSTVTECPGNYINRPKRVPIFIAFKIPTFATNEIESLSLQNSGQLTADTLNTQDTQERKLEIQNRDSRGEFLGEINQIKQDVWDNGTNVQRLGLIIDCQGMPQCEGAHDQGTELRLALVHIINGSDMSCQGTNFRQPNNVKDIIYDLDNPNPISAVESGKGLGTPAVYTANDSRLFQKPFFNVNEPSGKSMRWDWKLWLTKSMANQIKSGDIPPEQKPVHENVGVHIVAPLGTDLTYIESAMTNLFSAGQIEKLIEANVMVDVEGKSGNIARYFPIEDAKIGYTATGKKKYRHEDCPDETREVCILGICHEEKTGRKTDCATAGVKLKDDNVGLFIKGAKLGWFVQKIQANITSATSPTYNYIASCERIVDLFLGRCSGDLSDYYGPPGGNPYNGSAGFSGSCEPITDSSENSSSPCNINNLTQKLKDYVIDKNQEREALGLSPVDMSEEEYTKRAAQASIICNAESGGNPDAMNQGCLTGGSVDYSIGLFQINLLAHSCPEYFDYSWSPPWCEILVEQDLVDQCAQNMSNADTNIQEAFRISNYGSNWGAWATAKAEYCGPALSAVN